MSVEICESCGNYFSDQDMICTGSYDAGAVVEPTYICSDCAHLADVDDYYRDMNSRVE